MTAIVMNGTIGLKAAMADTPYTYGGAGAVIGQNW
ncbi:hypothetical protein GGE48_000862 [Rhizobium leguminosarum]|nr:hypothetical protein [Rhizobium leguminosarum]